MSVVLSWHSCYSLLSVFKLSGLGNLTLPLSCLLTLSFFSFFLSLSLLSFPLFLCSANTCGPQLLLSNFCFGVWYFGQALRVGTDRLNWRGLAGRQCRAAELRVSRPLAGQVCVCECVRQRGRQGMCQTLQLRWQT